MSLDHLVPITEYVPTIYKGVKEMDVLCEVEDEILEQVVSTLEKEGTRMCIQTSDEIGVRRYERVYSITPNPEIETLDFRKERLLTRSNISLPYSTIWLRNYLNAVIGKNNYELKIDYENLVVRLYGYLLDYNWAREFSKVIRDTKPCNIIFINIPTMIEHLGFEYWLDDNTWDDSVWNDTNIWQDYRVLTSEELIHYKKETDESKLNILKGQVNSIKLNNSTVIENMSKTVNDNIVTVNFTVPDSISLLQSVEILEPTGQTLLSIQCFIDTPSNTQIEIRLNCYYKENI